MNHIPPPDEIPDTPQYHDPRHGGTEAEIRQRVYPEPLVLIPGLLTSGLTVLAAGPKIGKSVLSQQIEHYLSAGIPFKGWPAPRTRHRVLVLDLEGNAEATQDTSLRLAPDVEDDRFGGIEYLYQADLPMSGGMHALLVLLAEKLAAARAAGDPYTYVRIDTMRLFTGPNGGRTNAYDFDAQANATLNQLGLAYGCAVLVLHHLTKASEESGDWMERLSGSMGVSGSATSIWLLERARGASTGVWRTTSRRLREAEHALTYEDGKWAFAENLTVDQAMHSGVPRKIIDYLTRHPTARWADLRELGPPGTVRKSLTRLGHSRTVQVVDGIWSLVRQPENPAEQPEPTRPDSGWGPGTIGDAAYEPPPHPQRPRQPAEPDPPADPDPEQVKSALGTLKDTIGTVETRACHPIPLIRTEDRSEAPWSIATRASYGRHRWQHPALHEMDGSRSVVVIDRRASFPSAMSNVPVAPNKLLHTGPTEYDHGRAGLYLIEVPADATEGGRLGHVLGIDAEGSETLWITTPGIRALVKGIGITPRILDSWTGKSVSNLFEGYNRWCRGIRTTLEAQRPAQDAPEYGAWADEYAAFKATSSKAIRLIWPKSRESGLWRPDWHSAILAEANIRHWMVARRSGAELLAMANTDEAVFAIPGGADPGAWLPSGYVEGPRFGQVSVKYRGPLTDWRDRKRGRRGDG